MLKTMAAFKIITAGFFGYLIGVMGIMALSAIQTGDEEK